MGNVLGNISTSLSIYKSLHGFGKKLITGAKTRFSTPLRVEKLADDFFSSVASIGSVVTVEGYLSKYGFCYKPATYSTTLTGHAEEKQIGLSKDSKSGQWLKRMQMQTTVKLFQFPVQILPAYEMEESRFNVAFIYPKQIESFILKADKTKEKEKKSENNLQITSIHRAIPVLLEKEEFHNCCESNIKLTGIISLLPESMTNDFLQYAGETLNEFSYHFLRPHSPNIGFCIDCRDKINSDFDVGEKPKSFPGAIYVEAHLEGINGTKYNETIKNSIPRVLPWSFRWGNEERTFYNVQDNISVVGTENHSYGFYLETDLYSQITFDKDMEHLTNFYHDFRKSVMNNIREEHGVEARLRPDFVFDYRRQKLFHPEGVLTSKEAKEVINGNQTFNPVANWVKKEI